MDFSEHLNKLKIYLKPFYNVLSHHPIYKVVKNINDLQIFMESHVFAVWDFMSLLKTLQNKLTCRSLPWKPNQYKKSSRLINEIVLGEESDKYDNEVLSHFEIYLRAMREAGVSVATIETFLKLLNEDAPLNTALLQANAPKSARVFVEKTFSIIHGDQLHAIVAVFTFGREDIIPEMFREFIANQEESFKEKLKTLHWYFERHIHLDSDEHGPMALEMLQEICGNDPVKWQEAQDAAEFAIRARIELWDNIHERIRSAQAEVV